MAWTQSTVGNAASGADYAADIGALQLWEDAIDGGSAGDYEALIISNIIDDVVYSGFGAGTWNLWVHGNITGSNKRIITSNGGTVLQFQDANINTILIEDLKINGNSQNVYGIYFPYVVPSYTEPTVNNCELYNCNTGFFISSGPEPATVTLDNVLSHNNTADGFNIQTNTGATTITHRNCDAFKNGNTGFNTRNSSVITAYYYNCKAMNPTGLVDWGWMPNAYVALYSCISYDTTAVDGAYDVKDAYCVKDQTSVTTYFRDWTNNDFHLMQDTNSNWGTSPNANTPALDLDGNTRLNDDIGVYDYLKNYTRGGYAGLPADDSQLETNYSQQDYIDVATYDSDRVSQCVTNEFAVHLYKDRNGDSVSSFNVTWRGQSSFAPTTATVYLQVYNRDSTTWETLDSDNTTAANTDFILSGSVTSSLSDYYSAIHQVACRIQQDISVV